MEANAYTARHDPDGYVYNGVHSTTRNAAGYNNPKVDELLVKARTTIDVAQRKALYQDVQRLLLDDAPNVWLCNDNVTEALQAHVKGLKHAWLEK
jgi:peptide/nickel transport system substrate-binding protein